MELLERGLFKRARLLATGQLTSYGSGTGVDDGAYQKGIPKPTTVYTVLTLGQYSLNTNITINSKTDVHANACVFDNNTGLMWSRTCSASVGPAADGKIPWTTTGAGATAEGIFPYVAAANAASLAGYTDWRIPNNFELPSLRDMEAPTAAPNAIAFPVWHILNTDFLASSTTMPNNTSYILAANFSYGIVYYVLKTATNYVVLVRGG